MGRRRGLTIRGMLAASTLLAALLACGLPGQNQTPTPELSDGDVTPAGGTGGETIEETDTPPTEEVPTEVPTEEPPTEAPPPAEAVVLNTCDVLTVDDLQSILGESPAGTYDPQFASCSYATSGGPQLIIGAAQGEKARQILIEGMTLQLQYLGSPTAQGIYDEIAPSLVDMSLAEIVEAFAPIDTAMGREVTPLDDLGDAAYMLWIEQGGSAQLGVASGETVVSAAALLVDRTTGETMVRSAVETMFERLPESFVPAP